MDIKTWVTALEPAPCKKFRKQYGSRGEKLGGSLIFPLYSLRSKVIGFSARSLEKKDYTYYLIEPDFHWNPVLFGFHRALPKIWAGGDLWIVEGVFDLFAMEHIIPSQDAIVAAGRAMLTDRHYAFLRRFRPYVSLVFDMDEAGKRGANKVMAELDRLNISGRNFAYTGGKDPGDIWDQQGERGLKDSFIF
jgi:DNA primase